MGGNRRCTIHETQYRLEPADVCSPIGAFRIDSQYEPDRAAGAPEPAGDERGDNSDDKRGADGGGAR